MKKGQPSGCPIPHETKQYYEVVLAVLAVFAFLALCFFAFLPVLAFALVSAAALGADADFAGADVTLAGAGVEAGVAGACANATAEDINAAARKEVSVIFFMSLLRFRIEAHASERKTSEAAGG